MRDRHRHDATEASRVGKGSNATAIQPTAASVQDGLWKAQAVLGEPLMIVIDSDTATISLSLTPLRARLLIELLHNAFMGASHSAGVDTGASQIDGAWVLPWGSHP